MNKAKFRVICLEATYYFLDLQSAVIAYTDNKDSILQYLKDDKWCDVEEA